MKQIIDFFDRAYVINLADRTDRRRWCGTAPVVVGLY
jgi:hypothetical protein